MMSPSTLAVQKALDVLLKSINGDDSHTFTFDDPLHSDTSAIDHDVQAVLLAVEALTSSAMEWVSKVNKRRNTLVTFSSTPTELSTTIFEHALDASEGWDRRRDGLHSLAKVSAHWRDKVLNSPSLWASIDLVDGLDWVKLSLRRSLGGAMDIKYRSTTKTEALNNIAEAAVMQSHRWRSMDLLVTAGTREILRHLSKPLPLLESITISTGFFGFGAGFGFERIEILLARGPNLRSVSLDEVQGMRWDSEGLSRLHHLSISKTTFSLAQITSVIGSSPELQTLNLSTMYHDANTSSFLAPQTFPKLISLRLQEIHCNVASKIIQYINAPNLQIQHISSRAQEQSNTLAVWMALLDATGKEDSMMAAMFNHMKSQETIHIVAEATFKAKSEDMVEAEEHELFHIHSSHPYGRLSIKIDGKGVTQGLVEYGPKIPSANISGPVHLSWDGPSPIPDPSFLAHFPTLARLTVAGNEQEIPRLSEM